MVQLRITPEPTRLSPDDRVCDMVQHGTAPFQYTLHHGSNTGYHGSSTVLTRMSRVQHGSLRIMTVLTRFHNVLLRFNTMGTRSETVFVCSAVGVLPRWTVVIRVGTVLHQGRWSSVAIFNEIWPTDHGSPRFMAGVIRLGPWWNVVLRIMWDWGLSFNHPVGVYRLRILIFRSTQHLSMARESS